EVDVDGWLADGFGRRAREGTRDLPRPIGSEVEKDNGVAIMDRAQRLPIGTHDHRRLDELIAFVSRVAGLNGFPCARRPPTFPAHIRGVRAGSPLPPVVAVHAVVAAADRPDASDAESLDLLLQLFEICFATSRR